MNSQHSEVPHSEERHVFRRYDSFCHKEEERTAKIRVPSDTSVRRAVLKEKIQKIYEEESHQNYGAPKITAELRKSGEYVSEKTVGNYMRQMGIKNPLGETIYPDNHRF